MQAISEDQKARIAADVAARYGVQCKPDVVQIVPRGVSGLPGYVFEGNQLVMAVKGKPGDAIRGQINAAWREYHRKRRVAAARAREAGSAPVKSERQVAAEVRLAQIRDMAARGNGLAEIARYMGVKRDTARNYCAKHGIEVKREAVVNPRWHERSARAKAWIAAEPRLLADIAAFMGNSKQCAKRFCTKHGLTYVTEVQLRASKPKKERRKPTGLSPERLAARDARRQKVAALHAEGLTPREMVERIGITKRPIYRDHIALGLTPHTHRARIMAENQVRLAEAAAVRLGRRRQEVLRLRSQGMTISQIAAALGASDSAVQRDMVVLGLSVKVNPSSYIGNPEYLRRVQAMRVKKMSVREIAEELELAKSTVSRIVNALRRAA